MRRVRTSDGARYYDLPIGAPITAQDIAAARSRNGGKPAPKGSTAQSSATRKVPAQQAILTRKSREAAALNRKVPPTISFSPPPKSVSSKASQVQVGRVKFKVDKDSKTFHQPDSDVHYNVDSEGNLRVLTPKGEAKLDPEQEAKVKALLIDERSSLEQEGGDDGGDTGDDDGDVANEKPRSRFSPTNPDGTPKEVSAPPKQKDSKSASKPSGDTKGKTGVFNEHDPSQRAESGSEVESTRLTDLGYERDEEVTVYRGVPGDATEISPGDWVTPNEQLAKDYAGTGKVISLKVKAQDLMTDPDDDSFEEMVYTPEPTGPSTDTEQTVSETMAMRPQHVSAVNTQHIDRLAAQMKREGKFIGEPIQVEETGKGPIVTDGNHRLLAAEKAGLTTVPVRTYANTPEGRMAANKAVVEAERQKAASPDGPTYGEPVRKPTSLGESVQPSAKDFSAMMVSPLTGRHVTPDGQFTPERKALHEKIISDFLDRVAPVESPVQYMNGGGPASGKGTMTRGENARITGYPPTHTVADDGTFVTVDDPQGVIVDPDQLKLSLPEAQTAVRNHNSGIENDEAHAEWAANLHEESSYLAKRLHQAALDRGVNIILDGVNDGSPEKVQSKVDQARAAGYTVEANYIYLDPEEGIARAESRSARSGRRVPTHVTIDAYLNMPKVFDAIKTGVFDKVRLFDNNIDGQPGRLIAEGGGDKFEFLKPEYEDVYDRFLESRELAQALMAQETSGAEQEMADNLQDLAGR